MSGNANIEPKKNIIVKDNALINASYFLDLVEQRIILLACSYAKKEGVTIDSNKELIFTAQDYSSIYKCDLSNAYKALSKGVKKLWDREVSWKSVDKNGKEVIHNSRWISSVSYTPQSGVFSIVMGSKVVPLISELEKRFTSFYLSDMSKLTSFYALRLYEIIMAWKTTRKTPYYSVEELREMFKMTGDRANLYSAMADFKRKVIEQAIDQINEHTNIEVRYEQHNRGRSIIGFTFFFTPKDPLEFEKIEKEEQKKIEQEGQILSRADFEKLALVGESERDARVRLKNRGYKFDF